MFFEFTLFFSSLLFTKLPIFATNGCIKKIRCKIWYFVIWSCTALIVSIKLADSVHFTVHRPTHYRLQATRFGAFNLSARQYYENNLNFIHCEEKVSCFQFHQHRLVRIRKFIILNSTEWRCSLESGFFSNAISKSQTRSLLLLFICILLDGSQITRTRPHEKKRNFIKQRWIWMGMDKNETKWILFLP